MFPLFFVVFVRARVYVSHTIKFTRTRTFMLILKVYKFRLRIRCINARRARATAFPYKAVAGREGGLSEPRARLVNRIRPRERLSYCKL